MKEICVMANTEYKIVDHYEFDEELLKKAFAEVRQSLNPEDL